MRNLLRHWLFLPGILIIVAWLVYWLFSGLSLRVDLTSDKRFTLTEKTISLLESLEKPLEIRVYLGDNREEVPLPVAYRQLNDEIDILTDNLSKHAPNGVSVTRVNLEEAPAEKEALDAARKFPILHSTERGPERVISQVYPYASMSYDGKQIVIDLTSAQEESSDEDIAASLAKLEHRFCQGIQKLKRVRVPRIAIASGHGELSSGGGKTDLDDMGDLLGADAFFAVDTLLIHNDRETSIPEDIDLLIIAQPKSPMFSSLALKSIDDFIMQGGNVMMFLEPSRIDPKSPFAAHVFGVSSGLEPLLSTYGLRLNKHLVANFNCVREKMPTGGSLDGLALEYTSQPEFKNLLWPFFGLLEANPTHPTGQLEAPILGKYSGTLDIKQSIKDVEYTPILSTHEYVDYFPASTYNEILYTEYARDSSALESFTGERGVVGYLLEGDIPSHHDKSSNLFGEYRTTSSKIMVFADGDLIQGSLGRMGMHNTSETQVMYGNRDFLRNCVEYILGEEVMIPQSTSLRKDVYMDTEILSRTRSKWLWINFLTPLISLLCLGVLVYLIRKRFTS